MVIFEMHKEHCRQVLADDKIDVVFPIDIEGQPAFVATLYIIIKGVEHRGIGDAFSNRLLVVDDDIDTKSGSNILSRNPKAVLVVIALLDTEIARIGQILVEHEGDFASHRAQKDLETVVLGLVGITG